MNRHSASLLVASVLLAAAALLVSLQRESAAQQPPQPDWSHIQVVTYASGLTGFFDARDGKLYLYDGNLEKPFIVRQIQTLGEPLKRLQN